MSTFEYALPNEWSMHDSKTHSKRYYHNRVTNQREWALDDGQLGWIEDGSKKMMDHFSVLASKDRRQR